MKKFVLVILTCTMSGGLQAAAGPYAGRLVRRLPRYSRHLGSQRQLGNVISRSRMPHSYSFSTARQPIVLPGQPLQMRAASRSRLMSGTRLPADQRRTFFGFFKSEPESMGSFSAASLVSEVPGLYVYLARAIERGDDKAVLALQKDLRDQQAVVEGNKNDPNIQKALADTIYGSLFTYRSNITNDALTYLLSLYDITPENLYSELLSRIKTHDDAHVPVCPMEANKERKIARNLTFKELIDLTPKEFNFWYKATEADHVKRSVFEDKPRVTGSARALYTLIHDLQEKLGKKVQAQTAPTNEVVDIFKVLNPHSGDFKHYMHVHGLTSEAVDSEVLDDFLDSEIKYYSQMSAGTKEREEGRVQSSD